MSNWPHNKRSVQKRNTTGQNEENWVKNINEILQDKFGICHDVPSVFIDARYDKENNQENDIFQEQLKKLEDCLETFSSYNCSQFDYVT